MTQEPGQHYVLPDQLCIGLYVFIDLSWLEHPFALSSFKIKTDEQLNILRSLGQSRYRYDPAKSDVLPPAANPDPPPVIKAAPGEHDAAIAAKKARLERLQKARHAIVDCEKHLLSTSRIVKSLTRNLFAKPQESVKDANQLMDLMLDSMLTDKDVAIHLMSDKVAGEEVYQHSLNVAVLAMIVAKELDLPREQVRLLGLGALFHDIGKVEVPERILYKTTPLTNAEREFLQQHVAYGLKLGKTIGLPAEVMTVIFQHHEYVNGTGYPKGAKGEALSMLSKIVCVANDYDNLCNRPNTADSLTPHEGLAQMFAQNRARYEPSALNVFIRCLGVYPPGTVVVLTNEVLGIVVSVNSSKPLRPCVLIYDPNVPKNEAVIVDLEEETDFTIARSIRPGQLPKPVFDYLNPRKRMTYFFGGTLGGDK